MQKEKGWGQIVAVRKTKKGLELKNGLVKIKEKVGLIVKQVRLVGALNPKVIVKEGTLPVVLLWHNVKLNGQRWR